MNSKTIFPKADTGSLEGQLLVATPSIQDSCFARSVIYVCSHNKEGAMGVIINYPVDSVKLEEVLGQLDIEANEVISQMPIYFGGPVEPNRGFVVHDAKLEAEGEILNKNGVAVSASLEILQSLAHGMGNRPSLLVLGYAGWEAQQLESEIETGSWFVVPATPELVFDTENEQKWSLAVSELGVDMGHFSSDVGHA